MQLFYYARVNTKRRSLLLFAASCLLCADSTTLASIVRNPANERIIGGQNAAPDAFPSAVSLDILLPSGVGLCGGTLINTHAVVTAAHCVYNFETSRPINASDVHVGYGSNNRQQQTVVTAREIHVHPDFDPVTTDNDIALLVIEPVERNSSVQSATIFSGELAEGTNLTAVGWGLTNSSGSLGSLPDLLQQTTISIGTREECRKLAPNYESSNGPLVCTQNSLIPGSDTCQGDSGTGIYLTSSGQNYLVGLTSYGSSPSGDPTCALSDGLAIYTHVYYYKDFINQYAGGGVARHTKRPTNANNIKDQEYQIPHHHHHSDPGHGHSKQHNNIERFSQSELSDNYEWPTRIEHATWSEHIKKPATPENNDQSSWPEHTEQPAWPNRNHWAAVVPAAVAT
ncbi:trypsin-like serine protease [Coemansia reversa NRRL 1564]|uniref:Trypsin-like serine protease n=1 Tax=Coemansia reversa (strain ATCC 12441 / NRRL 1564) TaxID=763665 RepID=A0A2G5B746_COERN|nr:trypsin-like serine protease [Coemansia reversa NRRL 1564]|eukprot:PIA14846.1 trypsin-like serine protease [Coemansia reversa NRRL 1564]